MSDGTEGADSSTGAADSPASSASPTIVLPGRKVKKHAFVNFEIAMSQCFK